MNDSYDKIMSDIKNFVPFYDFDKKDKDNISKMEHKIDKLESKLAKLNIKLDLLWISAAQKVYMKGRYFINS